MSFTDERYLNKRQLAARYGVSVRAIDRWAADPDLGFPPVYDFADRPYRKLSDIEAWERSRATIAAANRVARKGLRRKERKEKEVAATS
jgi:predicted DNA-binding transcriptional regulator AlpA